MGWTMESVDCRHKEGMSGFWIGGESQLIVDWRLESVDCRLKEGVSEFWTGDVNHWIID